MERMNVLNCTRLIFAFALIAGPSVQAQEATQKQNILDLIAGFSLGNNAFYSKVISPAKTLDLNLSDADRTAEINNRLASELDSVMTAFKKCPGRSKRQCGRCRCKAAGF